MFSLINQQAKVKNINVRSEKHGDENHLAADIKISIKVSNDILAEFDPALKSSLYKKGDESQGELIDDANHLPELKFPKMGSIGWDAEWGDFDFTLHYGIGGKSDIKLQDCTINKFRFNPQAGGTVEVEFRIITHPEAAQLGRLCEFIQETVEISMVHTDEADY